MSTEDLQKFSEYMDKRQVIRENAVPVVYDDSLYFENSSNVFKKYYIGIAAYIIALTVAIPMLSKIESDNRISSLSVVLLISLIGYVLIVYKSVLGYTIDVLNMQQCSGYCRISKTINRISRKIKFCAVINFVVCNIAVSAYYLHGSIFNIYVNGIYCMAVLVDCLIYLLPASKRRIIFRFKYGFVKGKTSLTVTLKDGHIYQYHDDFDLLVDNAGSIVVRQDSYYEIFEPLFVDQIVIQNDNEHKVVYWYDSLEWRDCLRSD